MRILFAVLSGVFLAHGAIFLLVSFSTIFGIEAPPPDNDIVWASMGAAWLAGAYIFWENR